MLPRSSVIATGLTWAQPTVVFCVSFRRQRHRQLQWRISADENVVGRSNGAPVWQCAATAGAASDVVPVAVHLDLQLEVRVRENNLRVEARRIALEGAPGLFGDEGRLRQRAELRADIDGGREGSAVYEHDDQAEKRPKTPLLE